jgi:1,4-alpha-glucan branching enzyme
MANEVIPHSLFSEFDVALFQSGKHFKLYEKFGSHELEVNGEKAFILRFGLQMQNPSP